MTKNEHIVVYAVLGLLALWLLLLTVIVAGELSEINRSLIVLAGGEPPNSEEPGGLDSLGALAPPEPSGGQPGDSGLVGQDVAQVGIAGVTVLTDSVVMTVTVRAYGAGDLLFEPPVLASEEGILYLVTADSLQQARLDFLDLVISSQATTRLEFVGRLAPTEGLWLVFNPNQDPSSVIAPVVQVAVPLMGGVTVENTPGPETAPGGE